MPTTRRDQTCPSMTRCEIDRGNYSPPTQKKIATKRTDATVAIEGREQPPATLADVEDVLGDEWDFGVVGHDGSTRIRTLIAGE